MAELPDATGPFSFGEPARGFRTAGGGELWRASVVEDDAGLWAVEEGDDFVLRGDDGKATLVLAEGGRLVNADRLTEGDEVAVFGLPGRGARSPSESPARPTAVAVCAPRFAPVRKHPLLVSVIRRYDQGNDGPQD